MKKINIATIILGVIATLGAAPKASAQNDLFTNDIFYHAMRSPQTNNLNPAFFPRETKFYLTLPQVQASFGFPISYNDIGFRYDPAKDKTYLNLSQLANSITENNNKFHFSSEIDILGFGVKVNKLFFTFSSQIHTTGTLTFPVDLLKMLNNTKQTNSVGIENALHLASSDLATINSFVKFSVGGGYDFDPIPLTIGGHINVLNGLANVNTDQTDIKLYATDNYYNKLIADVDYSIYSAGLINFDTGGVIKLESGIPLNAGVTIDLGASYRLKDATFSFSIVDLGPGVRWNNRTKHSHPINSCIEFDGFALSQMLDSGQFKENFFKDFGDSLTNLLKMETESAESYWYAVPTKINLGASYTFLKYFRAGLLFHGEWEKGLIHLDKNVKITDNTFRFNTSISLSASLFDWAEIFFANSVVFDGDNTDLLNPGVGLSITPFRVFQVYAVVDYISDIRLVNAKSFNCAFGINLLFGKREK